MAQPAEIPGGYWVPGCLNTDIPRLLSEADSGALEVCCGAVARFYGEPLRWALNLPLPELVRWRSLMPAVRAADPYANAVWIRKPPED